ncbi:40S ribosomal protein S5-1 [Hordeum vulgare]|nr:40S ribosomal protein S5-1 [Hordeum vulgare]
MAACHGFEEDDDLPNGAAGPVGVPAYRLASPALPVSIFHAKNDGHRSGRRALRMTTMGSRKDKIFEKVINPYLTEVPQHPQSIEMREGMLHIREVEGPKKTGTVETRLEAMEQQVFKCQGMVERGLNANHMMITEFTNKHKMDANDIGKHLSRLYDRVDQLQGQI